MVACPQRVKTCKPPLGKIVPSARSGEDANAAVAQLSCSTHAPRLGRQSVQFWPPNVRNGYPPSTNCSLFPLQPWTGPGIVETSQVSIEPTG